MSQATTLPPRDVLAQQGALARFGEFALQAEDLGEILHEACRLVAEALGTEFAKVVELQADRRTLLVSAGTGWRPGVVGAVRTSIDEGPEGLALRSGNAVVSPDLVAETRFEVPAFVREHGCLSTVCVVIVGLAGSQPYGVLQVDSTQTHAAFGQHVAFLQTYANMLASAVGRLRAAAELRRRADDNERLLRELQHRVKNNLQVMVAMLELQSRQVQGAETQAALRSVAQRVEALRVLHDKLHLSGEVDQVDLGDYLAQLSAGLLGFHEGASGRVQLLLDVRRGLMATPDQAAPLGLAVNEFITNSLKHAFGEESGHVGLRLEATGANRAQVTLWDTGRGLPPDRPTGGGGMRMIENFGRQLGSAAHWTTGMGGTRLEMTIRLGG